MAPACGLELGTRGDRGGSGRGASLEQQARHDRCHPSILAFAAEPIADLAELFSISRPTVYRTLGRHAEAIATKAA
jgi:hypothetical protein